MKKLLNLVLVVTMLAGLSVSVFAETVVSENTVSEIADGQFEEQISPSIVLDEEYPEQRISEGSAAEEAETPWRLMGVSAEIWDIGIDGSLVAELGKDCIITGTTTVNTITIPNGYNGTITLDNVSGTSISFGAGSDVALVLQGINSFTPTVHAETAVAVGGTLTISGSGSLTVNPIQNGSSIYVPNGSTLIINDGTIVANGSNHAAGIGGKRNGSAGVGTIIINGGNVTANGGGRWSGCAGIGTGIPNPGNDTNSTGGTIIINGGTVNATGGYSDGSSGVGGSGIGMGRVAPGGTNLVQGQKIIITGGNITASGGLTASAIGAGDNSSVKTDLVVILPSANIVSLTSDNAPQIGNTNKIFYLNNTEINDIGSVGSDTVEFTVKATETTESLEAFADFSAYDAALIEVSPFSLGMSEAELTGEQAWDLQYYNDMVLSGTGNVVFSADGYPDTDVAASELAMGNAFAFVLRIGGNAEQSKTIDVTYGTKEQIIAAVSNAEGIENKTFELVYDSNLLEIDDLALQTSNKDRSVGLVSEYPLEIIEISDGKVKFKYTQSANDKNFSGVISIITLQGIGSGQSEIQLNMY